MERKSTNTFTAEAPKEGADSSDKETTTTKKKTLPRVPIQAPVTERPHAFGAPEQADKPRKSLFEFSDESSQSSEAEVAPDAAEHVEALSSEERHYVAEQIASDHLESMPSSEEEMPDVAFLERIQSGSDVETAFTETATELGMSEDDIEAALAELPAVSADDSEATSSEINDVEDGEEIDLSSTNQPTVHIARSTSPVSPQAPPVPALQRPAPAKPTKLQPKPSAKPVESFANRRNRAGELVVVGIVGYLIGKRRGRIKTEAQLIPVQKKLEKQVTTLEQNIAFKEQQLKSASKRLELKTRQPNVRAELIVTPPIEQRMQPSRAESRLGLEKPARAEHLAHMIVAAEAPRVVTKPVAERRRDEPKTVAAEAVKDMPRAQLLEVSEKIVVEGANLRQIYETRLIGEKQLRHLVSEHLQGKDIRKTLRREIVEREIDFERDPMMRDRIHGELSNGSGSGGLGELLSKAGVVESKSDQQLARQMQKEAERRAEADRKQQRQRLVTDSAMVTAVVVLAVAVVILAFRG